MRYAKRLREQWGNKPCDHLNLDREYDLGGHTGDVVCVQCGRSFASRADAEADAARRLGNAGE